MDDYGLDVARAALLEEMERYSDAADLHLAEGNVLDAIRLLMLDVNNEASIKKAFDCLLDGLWLRLSYGVNVTEDILKSSTTLCKLLRLADGIDGASVDENTRDEVGPCALS